MKLYYVPMTRATRPRWLLEELGVPYELARLDVAARENRRPEYLRVHPLGHVPALVDGDVTVYESAAICLYLADKYPEKRLAPPVGSPQRASYYQWVLFTMATLEPPLARIFEHTKKLPEAERSPVALEAACVRFREVAAVVEQALADRPFILGAEFSAADVVLGAVLAWAKRLGVLEAHPRLTEYATRVFDRPAARRARAD